MLSIRELIGEVEGKHEHDSSFHLREHLAALDMEHHAWAPLLHHREGNLWRCIPIYNAQSMYTVYIYYFYSLYSAYESVEQAGNCGDSTFCMEIWGTCSLFSTSEVLSCLGMLSMTPQQVHCWLWCWTWHSSGIGPLFRKSTSHLTCITLTWF